MAKTINTGAEDVAIANLKPHPRNVNEGDFGAIQESIEANGFFGRIVVNRRTKHILAGNHRYAVAKSMGFEKLPVEWVDCDDETELRILLADNRTARLGHDNEAALAALLAELAATERGLPGTGFDGDDLDRLIADLAGTAPTPELLTDPDDVPESAPTRCNPGDLWQLGRHRLLCGDSTDAGAVARLMDGEKADMVFCDPPYGIEVVNTGSGKVGVSAAPGFKGTGRIGITPVIPAGVYAPIIGDDSTETAGLSSALALSLYVDAVQIWWGGNFYASLLPDSPHWIVWDKQTDGNQFADAELAWTNQKGALRQFRHQWMGMLRDSERGEKRVHPTQKPVALAEWCIEKYGEADGIMLDLFGGSGMSLIACERRGWAWRGIELSPACCDVILARWEAATGGTATLLEAGNGGT